MIKIPTPKEIRYEDIQNSELIQCLELISNNINQHKFSFRPTILMISLKNKIELELLKSNWKLIESWKCTKDDGCLNWDIVPVQDNYIAPFDL